MVELDLAWQLAQDVSTALENPKPVLMRLISKQNSPPNHISISTFMSRFNGDNYTNVGAEKPISTSLIICVQTFQLTGVFNVRNNKV